MEPATIGAIVFAAMAILYIWDKIVTITRFNNRLKNIEKTQYTILNKTLELHEWHDHSDADGVKVWYVRRSLEDAINRLADNVAKQTEVFSALIVEIKASQSK